MLRFVAIAFLLSTCGKDESIAGFVEPDAVYTLTVLNDAPFPAQATIIFDRDGNVTGTGPCNSFRTRQTVPYPWFEIEPIASTRRACADLPYETAYFAALSEMRFAEVAGDVLILSNDDGAEMVFQAE
jgi:heat shock protein HslJ